MQFRQLGKTGLDVSVISFGTGPIPALLTGQDEQLQRTVIRHALDRGINWFDTAAGYGEGASERNLGAALTALGARDVARVATKVRLQEGDLADIPTAVARSVRQSLERLQLPRVTLLQLHNSVTAGRGDEPTSITPDDVLGPRGVLEGMRRLRDEGLVQWLGLTGIGQADALRTVISSDQFHTLQVPYNLLNPSAGQAVAADFPEANYGQIMNDCRQLGMGVFAIRVFAGGALAGLPPSDYTFRTRFFPLELYRRDQARAADLAQRLTADQEGSAAPEVVLKRAAIQFALAHPAVTSAIIGFNAVEQIDEAEAAL